MRRKHIFLIFMLLIPLVALEVALRVAGIGGSIVYETNADYGYRPVPDQRFSTMGHPIRILPNGFRGPAGTNALLLVGDSVTYGTAYIRDQETFGALLSADNAGVNGWGLQNVSRFLEQMDCTKYRAIVWVIPSCDSLRPFTTLRAGLISTNRRMIFRTEYLLRFIWYGYLRSSVTLDDPTNIDANRQAILSAFDQLKSRGCHLLLVFLPSREEAAGGETVDTPYFHQLIQSAEEAGIPLLVAEPHGESALFFRDTAHLTVEGNRWLAGEIEKALLERRW